MVQIGSTAAAGLAFAALLAAGAQLFDSSSNRYQVAAAPNGSWRIDTATGLVSVCRATSYAQAPICSPFGAQALEAFRGRSASSSIEPAPQAPKQQDMTAEEFEALLLAPSPPVQHTKGR